MHADVSASAEIVARAISNDRLAPATPDAGRFARCGAGTGSESKGFMSRE
jgi:hypothetical protein